MQPTLTIAEAARLVEVSTSTIRGWERAGLISPVRRENGRRLYSGADVDRLRQIKRLRLDGLGIPAIIRMLSQIEPGSASRQTEEHEQSGWQHKLAQKRRELGMSLREVSAIAGLAPSFISAIERGHANPSLSALKRLTAAYDTTIVDLLETPASVGRGLVRVADRLRYPNVGGVTMEQLNFGEHLMELHLFTVEPGATSGDTYRHTGEEFVLLLEGKLEVWLEPAEHHILNPGDVLYFESHRAHRWANPGDTPAVFLGVNTPKTF
jgi:DNA-binding transcriptional MerR regulator/quercetin dioxygenase-like cupin family protein